MSTSSAATPAELIAAHPESVPGTPTYVLARDDGVWRIAAAQNTSVIDAETLAAGQGVPGGQPRGPPGYSRAVCRTRLLACGSP